MDSNVIDIVINSEITYYIQFLSNIVRNYIIVLGKIKMNVLITNLDKDKSIHKIYKLISRYCGPDVYIDQIKDIITIESMQIFDYTKKEKNKIHIYDENEMNRQYILLLKKLGQDRIRLDKGHIIIPDKKQIDIYVDGLTYLPNAFNINEIAKAYDYVKFHIFISDKIDDKQKIIEKLQNPNIFVINEDIIEYYNKISKDSKLYMIETVNASPHTILGQDIKDNKIDNIALLFGSEKGGISQKMLGFVNDHENHQNLIIESKSPYIIYRKSKQTYSINLSACISIILSTLEN